MEEFESVTSAAGQPTVCLTTPKRSNKEEGFETMREIVAVSEHMMRGKKQPQRRENRAGVERKINERTEDWKRS
ncbi:unnamed protein product [Boreogadus saida]